MDRARLVERLEIERSIFVRGLVPGGAYSPPAVVPTFVDYVEVGANGEVIYTRKPVPNTEK